MAVLDPQSFSTLAQINLGHVRREYTHSESIRLNGPADLAAPSILHPVFYGSYDWHSCVHSYWLLTRALACDPALPEAGLVTELFDAQLTADKVAGELEYFQAMGRGGFERPYGWAWLLKLSAAMAELKHPRAGAWDAALRPLADLIAERFQLYLPKLTFPIRSGAHNNTAFALYLALDYARGPGDQALVSMITEKACSFYGADRNCQAWEPGGEDFLSPTWQEALLMQRVLPSGEFGRWFKAFLPGLEQGQPGILLEPVGVTERTDGRLAHLDGLNLSRAWCLRVLGKSLSETDPRRSLLLDAAQRHLQAGRAHLQDDYMGEHWLSTFLLLALEG
jgi:hypothetical protein